MSILIAYDGSADAKTAIEFAAKHLAPEPVTVLTIWEPLISQLARASLATIGVAAGERDADAHEHAELHSKEGVELAKAAGLPDVTGRVVADKQTVWSTIVEVADELDASIIVTGSRGLSGVRSALIGSVSNHVLHHAHRPTLIVPPAKH